MNNKPTLTEGEVERVKMLYRPVIDLDDPTHPTIPPNFKEADKALDEVLASKLEEMRVRIREEIESIVNYSISDIPSVLLVQAGRSKGMRDVLKLPSLSPPNTPKEQE